MSVVQSPCNNQEFEPPKGPSFPGKRGWNVLIKSKVRSFLFCYGSISMSHPCTFRHSSEDRLEGKQPEF